MKTILQTLFFFLLTTQIYFAQWEQTGPYGGSVNCLAISGSNLLAGGNRLYLSSNNGTSWDLVNNGLLPNMIVSGICVSGDKIFALTIWDGLFLSSNNGISWTKLSGRPTGYGCYTLAVFEPNIWIGTGGPGIYVSTNNGTSWSLANTPFSEFHQIIQLEQNLFAGTSSGVFISTDNGTNWTAVNNGLPTNKYVSSLIISGTSIFAGTYNAGVFVSINNGTNWVEVNNGLTDLNVHSLAASGTNIFAGTWNDGIFLSTNNGMDWTATNTGLPKGKVNTIASSGTNIFAGIWRDGVFFSTNNGATWTEANNGLSDRPIESLNVSGASIYVGDVYGYIFRSDNNGDSWTRLNLDLDETISVSCFAFIGTNIFAGTYGSMWAGSGIFLSTDNGASWVAVNNGLTNEQQIYDLAISGTNIFAATDSGVFISTNNAASWNPRNNGLPGLVLAICVFDTNIFAGSIYLSSDNGSNWTAVRTGVPTNATVNAFTVSGMNIFAGTWGDGVFLSTNKGANWTAVNNGLPRDNMNPDTEYENINCITSYSNNLFAGTDGKGIFLFTNNGTSWTEVNTGLMNTGIRSLAVSGKSLFAGTDGGVWRRSLSDLVPVELTSFTATANNKEVILNWSTATELNNQGFEVQRKFSGNDFVTVGSVKGNGTTTSPNNYTYVDKLLTSGKYFYRLKQIDFGGKYEYSQTVEINWSPFTSYKLEQNFSNPFNPMTTIGFGIPEKGNVRLSVLNILGEEIKILLNEEKEAGYHSIDFNGGDLPSGVYFYRIHSGNFIETKKMLLLK